MRSIASLPLRAARWTRCCSTAANAAHAVPSDPKRLTLALPARSGAGTAELLYTDVGASHHSVTAMMIHGAPGSTFDWRWFGGYLERFARVIRLELPGHGASSSKVVGAPANMPSAVWDVAGALALPADRPFVLVAHSLGAEVAVQAAAMHPERIRALVLLNPVGLRPHKALRPFGLVKFISAGLDVPLLGGLVKRYLQFLYVRVFKFPARTSADEIEWCQRRVAARDFERFAAAAQTVRDRRIPVFVSYTTDDPLVEPEVPAELFAALTDAATTATVHVQRPPHAHAHAHAAGSGAGKLSTAVGAAPAAADAPPSPPKAHSIRLVYDSGGHYLIKAHAAETTAMVHEWLQRMA